jgi:hypothetical protein
MGTHYVMLCLVFERHSSTFNVNLHDETSNSATASSNLPIGLSGTRPGGGDLQYSLDTHTGVDPAWGDPIIVMPKFGSEPRFEPEPLESNFEFGSRFRVFAEPNLRSSSRFSQ